MFEDFDIEDPAVKQYRAKELDKKEELYHKKFVNMLFALSGALVIMCIIIGVGLINNLEEMDQLKKSFNAVMADYGSFKTEPSETQALLSQDDPLPQGSIDVDAAVTTEPEVTSIEQSNTPDNTQVTETSNIMPDTYVVQSGDSLIRISYRFYATKSMVSLIQEANGIENTDKIYIGQKLILPKGQ